MQKNCGPLPQHFEENLNKLFDDIADGSDRITDDIGAIIRELKRIKTD